MPEAMSTTVYIVKSGVGTTREFMDLADEDKARLRELAAEEMAFLGIPIKEAPKAS